MSRALYNVAARLIGGLKWVYTLSIVLIKHLESPPRMVLNLLVLPRYAANQSCSQIL